MNDATIQIILTVGIVGLKQSQFNDPESRAHMDKLVREKYLYINKNGEYKLTLRGQAVFKKSAREYSVEITDLKKGVTGELSIDEFAEIGGKNLDDLLRR